MATKTDEKKPKTKKIVFPKQKTFTGTNAEELDACANEWLEQRARAELNPPQLGKAGGFRHDSATGYMMFVTYYWFEQIEIEIKDTSEGS